MKSKKLSLVLQFILCADVTAGAYIDAVEGRVDGITHPSNYTGSGSTVTVLVCIDPASLNTTDMAYSIEKNIDAFNQLVPATGNLSLGSSNNVPSNHVDFESVSLHEMGHCIGMAHINAASESGLALADQNYTRATNGSNGFDIDAGVDGVIGSSDDVRGDDVNLVWFRKSNNNPFTIDTVIDSTTYSNITSDLPLGHSFATNADRDVSALYSLPTTEAVMQQGTFFGEAQRALGHDDVATLRYAASGIDELASGTQDNYELVLVYGGISNSCDITISMTADTGGFASCTTQSSRIGKPNDHHYKIASATISFDDGFKWYFSEAPVNTAPVLSSIGDISLLDGENLIVNISATDGENDSLVFSDSALPSFASLVDNSDGTATLTISPPVGEDSITSVTVTVTDDGDSILSDSETFDIEVSLDSDGDGLSDEEEVIIGTDPNDPDSDDDGLSDYEEVITHGTSPNDSDSDGDFINDYDEVINGSDPNDDTSWPNFEQGDFAPLGAPDGIINVADYLIARRIVLGEISASSLELSYGDLFPPGSPDGVIDTSDLVLLLKLIQQ